MIVVTNEKKNFDNLLYFYLYYYDPEVTNPWKTTLLNIGKQNWNKEKRIIHTACKDVRVEKFVIFLRFFFLSRSIASFLLSLGQEKKKKK